MTEREPHVSDSTASARSPAPKPVRNPERVLRQKVHEGNGGTGHGEPDGGEFLTLARPQAATRANSHVRTQCKQKSTTDATGAALSALGKRCVIPQLDAQSPHQHPSRQEFDHAVGAKRLEHEALGSESGSAADDCFDDHSSDGQPFETQGGVQVRKTYSVTAHRATQRRPRHEDHRGGGSMDRTWKRGRRFDPADVMDWIRRGAPTRVS